MMAITVGVVFSFFFHCMNKARTEAFSDGVFAIAITLLVLDIKLPAEEAASDLELRYLLHKALPNILTFIFSFLVVGVFWVAHHRIFESIKSMNHYLLWSNIFYVMTIAVIPFPAAVIAQHPFFHTSVIFYLISFVFKRVAALFYPALCLYTRRSKNASPDA